jgi:hypothetical protein
VSASRCGADRPPTNAELCPIPMRTDRGRKSRPSPIRVRTVWSNFGGMSHQLSGRPSLVGSDVRSACGRQGRPILVGGDVDLVPAAWCADVVVSACSSVREPSALNQNLLEAITEGQSRGNRLPRMWLCLPNTDKLRWWLQRKMSCINRKLRGILLSRKILWAVAHQAAFGSQG